MAYGERRYRQSTTTGTDVRLPSVTTGTGPGGDKFGRNATTQSSSPATTSNRVNISSNTLLGAAQQQYWDTTFNLSNAGGAAFAVDAAGDHASFFNCQFELSNMSAAGAANGNQGVEWANRNTTGTNLTTGLSWNLYNCLVNMDGGDSGNMTTAGYVFDDLFDSTLAYRAGPAATNGGINFYGASYSKPNARLRRSTIYVPNDASLTSPNVRFGEHVFVGVPDEVTGMVFDGTRLSAEATYVNPITLVSPNFPRSNQAFFYNINTNSAAGKDKGWIVIGPFIWGLVENASMAATRPFPAKIGYGGGYNVPSSVTDFGQPFIQHFGYRPRVYEDAQQNTAAPGVTFYVSTNLTVSNTNTTDLANYESRLSTYSINSGRDLIINQFVTNTNGVPEVVRYSLDSGSTWTDGYFNWGRAAADSSTTSGTTLYNDFNDFSPGEGVLVSPVQFARHSSSGTSTAFDGNADTMRGQFGVGSTFDRRSLWYLTPDNAFRKTELNIASTPLGSGTMSESSLGLTISDAVDADGNAASSSNPINLPAGSYIHHANLSVLVLVTAAVTINSAGITIPTASYTLQGTFSGQQNCALWGPINPTSDPLPEAPTILVDPPDPNMKDEWMVSSDLASDANIAALFPNTANNDVTVQEMYAGIKALWAGGYHGGSTWVYPENNGIDSVPTATGGKLTIQQNDTSQYLINLQPSSVTYPYQATESTRTIDLRVTGNLVRGTDTLSSIEAESIKLDSTGWTDTTRPQINGITFDGTNIIGPRVASAFNTTNGEAFIDVGFSADSTIELSGGGSGTNYIIFQNPTALPENITLTINRVSGNTNTFEVVNPPDDSATGASVTYGTGVSAYTPLRQPTKQRVNIGAIPTGARYEIYTGLTFTQGTSTPAFQAVRGSETDGLVVNNALTFTSGTAGSGETQIAGLGGSSGSPGSNLQVIQASQTRACRAQAFAVPFNSAFDNTPQVFNPDLTVNAATDQSADISVGLGSITPSISISSTRLSSSVTIYSPTSTPVANASQIVVQVDGTPAGGEASGQQINYLCALARQANYNYLRNMRAEMGTLVVGTDQEYDIWNFSEGDRVLVRNETKVVHRAALGHSRDLQVLFNYTKSQGNNFTPYGVDHTDRVAAQNIGAFADQSGTNASPEVRGSVALSVSTSSLADDIVNTTQFQALAKEATVNTGFTAGAKEATLETVETNVTAAQTAVGSVYSGLRGAFDSLTDGTIYESGTTNFPES